MKTIEKGTDIDEVLREAVSVYGNRGSIEDVEDLIKNFWENGYRVKMTPHSLSFEDTVSGIKETYPVIDSTERVTLGAPKITKFYYSPKNN